MGECIKILFISHESEIGGSTMSLISLIYGMQGRNVKIEVLLPYPKGKAEKILKDKKISCKKMLYFRSHKKLSENYSVKYRIFDLLNIIATKKIARYIKKGRYNVVCSNSTGVDVGARAAELANVFHIYYIREMMEEGCNCEYRNKRRMKKLLENSRCSIFISKTVEEYYKKKYKFRFARCFYDGFIINEYYLKNHELLKQSDVIQMIQLGELSDAKGTMYTIELLNYLKETNIRNWKMEFVGNGSKKYIEQMKKKIEEYCLEDYVEIGCFHSNIKEKLQQKDILFMNSNAEGFGRVTVEGMLAGCLVIGRNVGGTKEIIEHGVNGLLFNTKEELKNLFLSINNENEKYRNIAKAGQALAREKFNSTYVAEEFLKVIEECLGKKIFD